MTEANSEGLPRVLIVDDSRMVRATIVKRIKDSYDVREEGDGEAGWAALLADPDIQVVISDLSMPKLDGYGLLEKIRASENIRLRELPVIMVSGEEDEAARQRAKSLGATDFVSKGTGTAELGARLDSLIKLSRASRELEVSRDAVAHQATVDPATGLYTRVYLEKQGEQVLSLAKRHQSEVSALAIGLDGLDTLKQAHGQPVVDKLIGQFARLLQSSVRKEDSVARLQDGEFIVLAPGTASAASMSFAKRLREGIARAAIHYGAQTLHMTVSIGIANNVSDTIHHVQDLFDAALKRMQEAYSAGGDQVVGVAQEVPVLPTVEQALVQIRSGRGEAVLPYLAQLGEAILPLLRLMETHYQIGMPLDSFERRVKS